MRARLHGNRVDEEKFWSIELLFLNLVYKMIKKKSNDYVRMFRHEISKGDITNERFDRNTN